MNKKEAAYVEDLQQQLRLAKAMRFTEKVEPDIPIPKPDYNSDNNLTKGYLFNTYGQGRIAPACSSSAGHCFGSQDGTTSQRGMALYSTKLLALRALRHAKEQEVAATLADIDKQIEAEVEAEAYKPIDL